MTQQALQEEDIYYTDMSVGEILQRARVYYGQSLQDVERNLRIRACQIQAIEQDDVSKLPGRVYAIGFVRSYAEYLGLDGERVVKIFKDQIAGRAKRPELHFPIPASDGKLPPLWLIVVSVAMVALIAFGWQAITTNDRSMVDAIPNVSGTEQEMNETQAYGPPAPEQSIPESVSEPEGKQITKQTVKQPETVQMGLKLEIIENSWVEIKDKSGKVILSRVLKAGDEYFIPERPDLTVSLGNAGGVKLSIGDKGLPFLGEAGQVKRDIPLDTHYLTQNYLESTSHVDRIDAGKVSEH